MAKDNDEVKIEHINPRTELNELEKTAILQFKIEQEEERLSRTTQFKFLNRTNNLNNTTKLNLSSLKEQLDMPKKKASLYDTIVIKLESLINRRGALNTHNTNKVIDTENVSIHKKMSFKKLLRGNNINKFKINVDSDLYGIYLYELNKYALTILSKKDNNIKVREYEKQKKLKKIDNINIDEESYSKYCKKLNSFAINKLYYKIAPKETNKYKIYKFSVCILMLLLVFNIGLLVNWYREGEQIKNISYSVK